MAIGLGVGAVVTLDVGPVPAVRFCAEATVGLAVIAAFGFGAGRGTCTRVESSFAQMSLLEGWM